MADTRYYEHNKYDIFSKKIAVPMLLSKEYYCKKSNLATKKHVLRDKQILLDITGKFTKRKSRQPDRGLCPAY